MGKKFESSSAGWFCSESLVRLHLKAQPGLHQLKSGPHIRKLQHMTEGLCWESTGVSALRYMDPP